MDRDKEGHREVYTYKDSSSSSSSSRYREKDRDRRNRGDKTTAQKDEKEQPQIILKTNERSEKGEHVAKGGRWERDRDRDRGYRQNELILESESKDYIREPPRTESKDGRAFVRVEEREKPEYNNDNKDDIYRDRDRERERDRRGNQRPRQNQRKDGKYNTQNTNTMPVPIIMTKPVTILINPTATPLPSSTPTTQQPSQPHQTRQYDKVIKLINEHMEFCNHDIILRGMSETNEEYTVIGVLGGQSSGKSFIMNALSGNDTPPFAVQNLDTILSVSHTTTGVDLFVTPERLILLDTQPIQSPSVLQTMIKNDTPLIWDTVSHENLHYLYSLQMVIMLLSICHIVVVTQEDVDIEVWRILRIAEMLRGYVPEVSVMDGTQEVSEYCAKVVFVYNNMMDEGDMGSETRMIDKYFLKTKIGKDGVYFIPPKDHPSHQAMLTYFKSMILNLNKTPYTRPIPEREWFRNSNKLWDVIKRSILVSDYNKSLQKMGLYKQ